MFDTALIHFFPFCYINKIWSSKWKGINCIQASSSFGSVFPNFLLLLSLLKGCKTLQCSVGENSFVSPFICRGGNNSKGGGKKTFACQFFLCQALYPEKVQELHPCLWQHPGTAPLCPQHRDNAQDWGLRGEKILGKGWGMRCTVWGTLPSSLRFSKLNSHLSCFAVTVSLRMLWVLPLSRILTDFLWRCLPHSRELCNKTHPDFPCRLCVCERDKLRRFPSPGYPRHPQKWELGTSTQLLQGLIHRGHLAGQLLMMMWFRGKRKSIFFIQQNLKLDQPLGFPVIQRTLA